MALEHELKFLDVDLDAARETLRSLGAVLHGRVFERNLVFDTPDRTLREQDVLLRLRHDGRSTVTLKRHPQHRNVSSEVKTWEEFESRVDNFNAMRELFLGLGYIEALQYEKIRETWELDNLEICLDTLPFGDFVEIEGDEAAITQCAARLGLSLEKASKATYHALNARHRRENKLPSDESFVFPPEDPRLGEFP
ncbi:MAG: CYTH domain-containing protein [Desulfovibrio sp.]|mgnify:CR=1 FL=1|nr:MAG: CYTH domain-containing protein [Desulfovibrio sp.]